MQALQAKQAAGEPSVVTTDLVTVRNDHWGVPPGIKVKVGGLPCTGSLAAHCSILPRTAMLIPCKKGVP